jgi:hypothetical protein
MCKANLKPFSGYFLLAQSMCGEHKQTLRQWLLLAHPILDAASLILWQILNHIVNTIIRAVA